jgi:hypothetical protein
MFKRDLLTGEEFMPSRKNQKFVTEENRIKYYANRNKRNTHIKTVINAHLKNNLKILNQLFKRGNEKAFTRQFLIDKGVQLNIHTHFAIWQEKQQIALYQYIFVPLENQMVKVIRNA